MSRAFRILSLTLLALLATALVGCSDDDDTPTVPTPEPEATYATLVFLFDDSVEQSRTTADGLAWKGTFSYDAASGVLAYDAAWSGPFVPLHDDGPVSAGGHEPEGAVAGDHVWGAVTLVESPAADVTLSYGVITGSTNGGDGTWIAGNELQAVEIAAGSEGTIVAPSLKIWFTPPANAALVEIAIDDRASATMTAGSGLAWKGSFSFDAPSRTMTFNGSWPGPYVLLWDDGSWTEGGHEATGATAGDHIWSVAVWIPNTATVTLEYGAITGSVDGSDGSWIWTGSNGNITIPIGATGPITAPGLTLP